MTNEERLQMVADVFNEYRQRIAAIERDADLSNEGKKKRLDRLYVEREDAIDHASEKAFFDLDFELEKQREKSEPQPPKKPTTQTELLTAILAGQERDRAERKWTAKWRTESGPRSEDYDRAVTEGDDLTAEMFEELAESYGADAALRMRLSDGRDRRAEAALPDSVKQAREKVADLERDRASLDMTLTALFNREQRRLAAV